MIPDIYIDIFLEATLTLDWERDAHLPNEQCRDG